MLPERNHGRNVPRTRMTRPDAATHGGTRRKPVIGSSFFPGSRSWDAESAEKGPPDGELLQTRVKFLVVRLIHL
ncbi:hypothetical protein GCM10017788_21340 [Amycolatopsis acidiphila]|nr:hypothetical protein GCM10017788_21340 [Amycolatopsis acidiphila]